MVDPRPEFSEDHELWKTLLTWAQEYDQEIFSALHCIRCGGAKIVDENGCLKFTPRFLDPSKDNKRGTAWKTQEDWKMDCKDLLTPHREGINHLMIKLEKNS